MLVQIKNMLPSQVKSVLISIKHNTYGLWQKKRLFYRMQLKHGELVERAKKKEKLKVVFLAVHKSVWKVDTVFQRMLQDPLFEPEILVCPYIPYGEERMYEDMNVTYNYFLAKGYPVKKSKLDDETWIDLKDLCPDIVFFTNPHKVTFNKYYECAYNTYLSCYVPYYYMATNHAGGDVSVLNTNFFMSVWRLYWASDYTNQLNKKVSASKGVNGCSLGYPAAERLLPVIGSQNSEAWKVQAKDKKRIIFAPHHSIEHTKSALSTFLLFGESIKDLAIKSREEIQWSFKPHPILKSKLYLHPDWGKGKTDEYYDFWKSSDFTQIDEGEYEELFLSSDAIVHDCSSFIVEYAFTGKPCLYLINHNELKGLLNDFGEGVMEIYDQAKSIKDIEDFVGEVVRGTAPPNKIKSAYFDSYVDKYYRLKQPSERIIEDIKKSLGVLSGN